MTHARYPLLIMALLMLALAPALRADTQRVEGLVFKRVEIFGAVEVEISQGEITELRLRGDSEELARQPFYLSGETLVLGRSAGDSRDSFDDVKYKLTLTDIDYLGLKGSGEVYVKPLENPELNLVLEGSGDFRIHSLRGKEISLVVSGSGDIQAVDLEAEQLRLALSGSGDIHVGQIKARSVDVALKGSGDVKLQKGGSAERVEINIAGSGEVDMSDLSASFAEINIAGSGTGRVGEIDSLEANMLGSGDVYYSGDPKIERSVLGSGDLHAEH